MDTTKTQGTTTKGKKKKETRKTLLKVMLFLFLLHAAVTFLSHGTGVVESFRNFFIHVFWPPEGWVGEPLPVHQQVVHAALNAIWSLPFWKNFWALCGFPMLPLMGAVLIVPELKFPTSLRRKGGGYVEPTGRYQNASTNGRFVAPKPSFWQKLKSKRRLLQLKKQSVDQVETLCQQQRTACLAEILSDRLPDGPVHLIHDLSSAPKWLFGRAFAQTAPDLLRELSLSQDRNGKIGLYYKKTVFLQAVPCGTFWAFQDQDGKLCLRNKQPDRTTQNVIQIRISQG